MVQSRSALLLATENGDHSNDNISRNAKFLKVFIMLVAAFVIAMAMAHLSTVLSSFSLKL